MPQFRILTTPFLFCHAIWWSASLARSFLALCSLTCLPLTPCGCGLFTFESKQLLKSYRTMTVSLPIPPLQVTDLVTRPALLFGLTHRRHLVKRCFITCPSRLPNSLTTVIYLQWDHLREKPMRQSIRLWLRLMVLPARGLDQEPGLVTLGSSKWCYLQLFLSFSKDFPR